MWMAGGGIKGGISVGETDELGSAAVEDRFHVKNLHATILHQLGLDPNRLTLLLRRPRPEARRRRGGRADQAIDLRQKQRNADNADESVDEEDRKRGLQSCFRSAIISPLIRVIRVPLFLVLLCPSRCRRSLVAAFWRGRRVGCCALVLPCRGDRSPSRRLPVGPTYRREARRGGPRVQYGRPTRPGRGRDREARR